MTSGILAASVAAAGRFRPTGRLAARALQVLRRHDLLPRQVAGLLNGRRILLNLDEDIDTKIFLYGAFDERGLKLIKGLLRQVRCRTPLDIGANIGSHTGFFCDWAERVYAFELDPPIAAQLTEFVRNNAIANVQVMPTACPTGTATR